MLTGKKYNSKVYEHVFKIWNKIEMKMMKDYHDHMSLKCDVLPLEHFLKTSQKLV